MPRLVKKDTAPAMFSSFHEIVGKDKLSGSCNLSRKDDVVFMSFHESDPYANSLGSFNKIKSNNSNDLSKTNYLHSSQISTENGSSMLKRNSKIKSNVKNSIIVSEKEDEWEVWTDKCVYFNLQIRAFNFIFIQKLNQSICLKTKDPFSKWNSRTTSRVAFLRAKK